MPFSSKRLAGPGFVILNIIRAMNITSFVAVIIASIVMVVKTFTISKFFFFDAATHIITALTSSTPPRPFCQVLTLAVFLLISECSIFKEYYARVWPVLSPAHGFTFLGSAMLALGNNILGNMNKEATSQKSLGLPFWRLVIASGIVVFIFGFVNIVAVSPPLFFKKRLS
jgi:hypothetical protein